LGNNAAINSKTARLYTIFSYGFGSETRTRDGTGTGTEPEPQSKSLTVLFNNIANLQETGTDLPPIASTTLLPSGKYWMSLISSMVPMSANPFSRSPIHMPNSRVPLSIHRRIISRYLTHAPQMLILNKKHITNISIF